MARCTWKKHTLDFIRPSGTSRGVLHTKDAWFLLCEEDGFSQPAIGECSIIQGLSPDPMDTYEHTLDTVCQWLNHQGDKPDLRAYPSIRFGLEMLEKDRATRGSKHWFPSAFTAGEANMRINGLIWMGTPEFMKQQVRAKVAGGFTCIKLKIGAIDFGQELAMLEWIRSEYSEQDLELRVDANGAFPVTEALEKLSRLSELDLHSIEQPIKAGQLEDMAELCARTPLPIALDEELIGINDPLEMKDLVEITQPQYIVLKPSLLGGWAATDAWIEAAEAQDVGWWITSALESNIGLSAIAQYTYTKDVFLPQGLGTGALYSNNFDCPLYLQGQFVHWATGDGWNLSPLQNE